jgi:mono/diheme cytochrome c family protein
MLAGRVHGSGPYGWQGQHGDLGTYVRNTISRLGGRGLEEGQMHALVEYLERMPAPPVLPEALPVDRARAIARGRELFFGASGCSGCHVDARGTDRHVHDIGTKVAADEKADFDTPTLRFVKGTAPYFHDGRYKTLADLLADESSKMGSSARLDARDRDALAAFVETL